MKVAIVHDYMTQYGGAERVVEALLTHFPGAPVFTSLYSSDAFPARFAAYDIRASSLQRIPAVEKHHRSLLPLYPAVFRWLSRELRHFDLVIASSSAWAHHVTVSGHSTLICYCHSPARFLHEDAGYLLPSGLPDVLRVVSPILLGGMRRLDQRAASRVDHYIANSHNVAERIHRSYHRTASVIHPPVEIDRFKPVSTTPEPWFLVVSRLVAHKRIDLVIEAAAKSGASVRIVGTGREESALRSSAPPNVTFLGAVSDNVTASLMARCQALIVPSEEDFGMTIVEVQAAGRPAVAFGHGGSRETIVDGVTGVLVQHQSAESIAIGMKQVEAQSWKSADLQRNAERFAPALFHRQLDEVILDVTSRR